MHLHFITVSNDIWPWYLLFVDEGCSPIEFPPSQVQNLSHIIFILLFGFIFLPVFLSSTTFFAKLFDTYLAIKLQILHLGTLATLPPFPCSRTQVIFSSEPGADNFFNRHMFIMLPIFFWFGTCVHLPVNRWILIRSDPPARRSGVSVDPAGRHAHRHRSGQVAFSSRRSNILHLRDFQVVRRLFFPFSNTFISMDLPPLEDQKYIIQDPGYGIVQSQELVEEF